ncbi:3'(2'),5'-bisphosphate nucleotidase CysQ [Thiomicrorhabdus sp. ZW0627]|uniref:3'(2'),5'-bisphosphate nucleotidase CysQ n=1 Tax=Thiomicrorhabdus sp. ZW0627 TaxID=3039774 RepID=UPI0024368E62|nr:3'(2'),5'-bisphosphate nucleotidase CysQ [Thiomicrorhabdus sp. ZW0627]MDG6773707.1 3'(2'),5'-bisphosphate nucleotidase CysQ [Thiomicrorhabdus sp. ZW0627]
MNLDSLRSLLPEVCRISVLAGERILEVYEAIHPVEVENKSDGTPVTLADKQADELICSELSQLTPDIPLVTEESVGEIEFETRQAWSTFWLVDPLDGTKEFIERTGEFSVNIALVQDGKPILGVVYVPMTRILYCAYSGKGAYKHLVPESLEPIVWKDCAEPDYRIHVHPVSSRLPIKVAVSRRHGGKVKDFMQALGETQTVRMGSAIKSCLVAEGVADVYPRFGPTSLWDTAAAQCVVEEAGGKVLDRFGNTLEYRQSQSLLNPYFMVVGDLSYSWPDFPG